VFEGFNVKNGTDSFTKCSTLQTATTAGGAVIQLIGSSNNVLSRIVAWDTCISLNAQVVLLNASSNNNLLEDVAAFGAGRKIFQAYGNSNNNIIRRAWFRWEGNTHSNPSSAVTLFYKSTGTIFENVLVTWSGESMPETYTDSTGVQRTNFEPPAPGGLIHTDRLETTTTPKWQA
jgi:hypothetical protein